MENSFSHMGNTEVYAVTFKGNEYEVQVDAFEERTIKAIYPEKEALRDHAELREYIKENILMSHNPTNH